MDRITTLQREMDGTIGTLLSKYSEINKSEKAGDKRENSSIALSVCMYMYVCISVCVCVTVSA